MTSGLNVRRALRSFFSRGFPVQHGGLDEVRGSVMLSKHLGRCCDHRRKLAREDVRNLTMQRLTFALKQRIVRRVLNERVPERIPGIGESSVLLQEAVPHEFGKLISESRVALAGHST